MYEQELHVLRNEQARLQQIRSYQARRISVETVIVCSLPLAKNATHSPLIVSGGEKAAHKPVQSRVHGPYKAAHAHLRHVRRSWRAGANLVVRSFERILIYVRPSYVL